VFKDQFPFFFIVKPSYGGDIGIGLNLVQDPKLLANIVEVLCDFWTGRV